MTNPYNADDPDQIRRDIERTQTYLSQDVDTLTEKVSPGRIVDRRVGRVRGRVQGWKDNVMGSDAPSHHAQHAAGAVSDRASAAGSAVSDAASGAAGAVQETPDALRRQARGNPLAAGLIAFGAGWLISSLIPASRREQELAEQAQEHATEFGRPVADAAKQAATEIKDNLAEPAQQAAQSVRTTATDAGRTVADEGRGAAEQVQGDARGAADDVRQQAQRN